MSKEASDRDDRGRFQVGNAGGPGRPRRAVESEYLAVLSEEVTLDTWRAVIRRAVALAQEGDHRARTWLGAHLIGDPTGDRLRRLTVAELRGVTVDAQLAEEARRETAREKSDRFLNDVIDGLL